jgi:branched-chain amino acid transport system ATP-binding protein
MERYVERAVAVADYVYILNKGRVAFTGLPAECSSRAVFARYLQGAAKAAPVTEVSLHRR